MNENGSINILHTKQCIIDVEPHKNRIYATIHGGLEEQSKSSLLLEKLHELKHYLRRGFTMLVDARQTAGEVQWEDVLHDILDLLFEGGIRKIAELHSDENLACLPEKWRSEVIVPDVYLQLFLHREHAEAWLDV